ncbi:AAA family ATPase, partial [Phytoactinopolyspora endophytica]|uniref:AAA family ATPase n=1 Tax=Phytoactinopolyspora endophytica TaxID=1642495 RepID=UPI0013EC0404
MSEGLRSMRSAAGHPSFAEIAKRVGTIRGARGVPAGEQRPARATVYDCFRADRRRLDVDLVVDIVRALGADDAEAARWAQTCRAAQSQADAATVVTAHTDLPAGIDHFVARDDELASILDACEDATMSHVFFIAGMPGSGKTQLAIKTARRLLDSARVEGVLHADLRGYHPDNPPADPAAMLDTFLRLFDVPAREIPSGLVQRQALFHQHLGSRRHVIILDDASETEQVIPLIPSTSGTIVLVTSRTALDGTTLSDGTKSVRVPLDVFTPEEAVDLLRDVAGADLVDADISSATQLVEASGCLPLAVGLTATRVAAKPGWTLADHL